MFFRNLKVDEVFWKMMIKHVNKMEKLGAFKCYDGTLFKFYVEYEYSGKELKKFADYIFDNIDFDVEDYNDLIELLTAKEFVNEINFECYRELLDKWYKYLSKNLDAAIKYANQILDNGIYTCMGSIDIQVEQLPIEIHKLNMLKKIISNRSGNMSQDRIEQQLMKIMISNIITR